MKFTCKRKSEIEKFAPELYCIEKKSAITQAVILKFLHLEFVTQEERETMRQCIIEERAKNEKNYMTGVRNKFIAMFYEQKEQAKKGKKRFEDKI